MGINRLPFAYEFRIFAPSLLYERALLVARANSGETQSTGDSYLVSRRTTSTNVKIRDNRTLEVKLLTGCDGGLQGWARSFAADLPVAADVFMSNVAPRLGVELAVDDDAALTEVSLLRLAEQHEDLAFVRTEKTRTVFDLGACRAEFAVLNIGLRQVDTIAVEASDAAALLTMLHTLELATRPNESYPSFLQKLAFEGVGVSRMPLRAYALEPRA